ncbi:Putative MetA-pathway of phenol degradation [Lutibacter oricola]|uniref:Putative MetA-pathway of phenol degradation n=1 Tax=Lutibacter oricola TaxID=762486 RepID=A0A1H3CAK7_9FLAO|nr:transporter [Lutibacter oricola]SDX51222.1 Putative MetA-pathway of phenol degradation [Lutibacter oricola]
MRRVLLLVLLLSCYQITFAQYTEIINSKRPGFSESPYSVGTDVYQFETGLFYRDSDNPSLLARPKSIGGELFFRYGKFFENLELNAKIAYQNDEVKNPFGNNYNIYGISELTIGAKYLIYQQKYTDKSKEIRSWKRKMAYDKKRLIPSVGVYAGVNTNFLGKDFDDPDGISFKGAILLQNDLTDRLVVITNLIADNITSKNNYYKYIITATYAMSSKWSIFVENQTRYQKEHKPKINNGLGLAYLYNKNLQLDASVRTNFFADYSFTYSAIGASWRLDRHSDEVIRKSSVKNPLYSKKRKRKKRGSFFKRMFKKKH